jgi:hypothetical protein
MKAKNSNLWITLWVVIFVIGMILTAYFSH